VADPLHRRIYEEILAHLRTMGPVHADVVRVGVFLKHQRTVVEVRPKVRSLNLLLTMPYPLDDPRVSRRWGNVAQVKVTSVDEVDDQLRNWLSVAYDFAGQPL